jgi:hypothetical protein
MPGDGTPIESAPTSPAPAAEATHALGPQGTSALERAAVELERTTAQPNWVKRALSRAGSLFGRK